MIRTEYPDRVQAALQHRTASFVDRGAWDTMTALVTTGGTPYDDSDPKVYAIQHIQAAILEVRRAAQNITPGHVAVGIQESIKSNFSGISELSLMASVAGSETTSQMAPPTMQETVSRFRLASQTIMLWLAEYDQALPAFCAQLYQLQRAIYNKATMPRGMSEQHKESAEQFWVNMVVVTALHTALSTTVLYPETPWAWQQPQLIDAFATQLGAVKGTEHLLAAAYDIMDHPPWT